MYYDSVRKQEEEGKNNTIFTNADSYSDLVNNRENNDTKKVQIFKICKKELHTALRVLLH